MIHKWQLKAQARPQWGSGTRTDKLSFAIQVRLAPIIPNTFISLLAASVVIITARTVRIISLLLFVLGTPLFAQTEESLETSGNAFLRICSVVDEQKNIEHLSVDQKVALMSCLNFVSGFTNGVEVEMLFVENATKQRTHAPFCVPESVENIQTVRVVLKYIRDNPAAAHRKTNSLIMFSLGERYPCPSH